LVVAWRRWQRQRDVGGSGSVSGGGGSVTARLRRQLGGGVAVVAASAMVAAARSEAAVHSATAAAWWEQRGGCGGFTGTVRECTDAHAFERHQRADVRVFVIGRGRRDDSADGIVGDGGARGDVHRGCQCAAAADDDTPVETSTAVANAPPPPTMTPPRTTPPTPSLRRSWRRWREKEQVQNL